MRLYFLDRISAGGWDTAESFVIRAESEDEARNIAADNDGSIWLDTTSTTCIILIDDGASGIVCRDFRAG